MLGAPGISQQKSRDARQKMCFPWASRDIPNFLAPTPSRARPPPLHVEDPPHPFTWKTPHPFTWKTPPPLHVEPDLRPQNRRLTPQTGTCAPNRYIPRRKIEKIKTGNSAPKPALNSRDGLRVAAERQRIRNQNRL